MRKILLSTFVAYLSYTAVFSQSPQEKVSEKWTTVRFESLQEVFDYANAHAFHIQASELEERADEARKQQAQSYLYPTVKTVSGYTDNITLQPTLVPAQLFDPSAPQDDVREMTFGKQHVYSLGVQMQWDILDFQKMFASETAQKTVLAGKANTEKIKYDTYNQIAATYYSILLMQKSIVIYAENVETTSLLLENMKEKYEQGIISEENLNRITIRHIQNEKNLDYAKNQLEQLYKQFQSQLGTTEKLSVGGDLESRIISDTKITTVNPEIMWMEAQLKVYESKVKQSKALRLPTLSFQYQYSKHWASNDFMSFSNANKLPAQYLGVKMSVPIFTGMSAQGKMKEAKTELHIHQLQIENTRLLKVKEDETLQLQYTQSKNSLEKAKEILRLQEINDKHTSNQYEKGIIGVDVRMDKYEDLLSAQYTYLQGLADYSIVQYKIYIRQINFNTQQ